MGLEVLLALVCGFFVGRVVDNVVGGGKKLAEVEEGGADEAAGAAAVKAAPPEPKAAKTGKKVAAKGTVVTMEAPAEKVAPPQKAAPLQKPAPPEKTGEPDLQQVILDVLSGTGDPDLQQVILDVLSGSGKEMTLAEIARKIGKSHYASLIGPMRSLLKAGRVVKEDKVYRLA